MAQSSRIFVRNRAIGHVSNHIPAVIRYIKRRKDSVIVTCVGKSFHTYSKDELKLLAVSDACEEEICCLAADGRHTFTAAGRVVQAWIRATSSQATYLGHDRPVRLLLPFGAHLLSVDDANILRVWERGSQQLFLELPFDQVSFKITAINHPSTYINKILLGSEQGELQLWNVKTSRLVYSFQGWGSAVTCLQQAPALDVTAVGLTSGQILLHHLKYDQTLMQFTQDWGPVLSLSFRTDGPAVMASSSGLGHVVLWDLEKRRLHSQILDAHSGPVSGATFLPNEPLLVTSSSDNSLKMWIFDRSEEDGGRLLRVREGHAAQPTFIRFHGSNGYYIMSSGTDSSLRVFSLVNETYNYSLGKASFNKKANKKKKRVSEKLLMPPIVEFTCEPTRDKEWDSIAAVHSGLPLVTTWSLDRRKMADLSLLPDKFSKQTRATLDVTASCLHLTTCGNFVLVGYSSGHVERFNVQSGIHRCQYGQPSAHRNTPVRGVLSDPLNHTVLTAGADGLLKFWPFPPDKHSTICGRESARLRVDEGISLLRCQKESSLVALALDDFSIGLVDTVARRVARRLVGHTGRLTDLTFSPDGRWLVSAGLDSTLRVWDLPTASLIDLFKVESVCTSLALSPSGHMLATIHVDNLGIYLWYNKTLYSGGVSLKPLGSHEERPMPTLGLPASRGVEAPVTLDSSHTHVSPDDDDDDGDDDHGGPDQIDHLITLSSLPSSRWLGLLDLDTIRRRNKPRAKLDVAQTAPFFLPTLPSSADVKFDLTAEPRLCESVGTLRLETLHSRTVFTSLLENTSENEFKPVIDKLKSLSPSSVHFEINSLGFDPVQSEFLLCQFMRMMSYMLETGLDFELAQAYLSVFLKVHGGTIAASVVLRDELARLESKQKLCWSSLQSDLMYLLSVIEGLHL